MPVGSWLGRQTTSPARRAARTVIAICSLMAVTTAPIMAKYDWCSRDPVLTFSRADSLFGLVPEHVLDVQVLVNNAQVAIDDVEATLNVTIPKNVQGVDALKLLTEPLFKIKTVFHQELQAVDSPGYVILIEADVPATRGDFATKLMITSVDGLTLDLPAMCAGRTGKTIRAKVDLEPFAVSCQQETTWVPVAVSQ